MPKTKTTHTPEDAARYLKAGAGCPYCGSDGNPEGGPWEVIENGIGQQEMTCSECGAAWFDIYWLTSVFDNDMQKHYGNDAGHRSCKWCGALQTIPGEEVHTRNCQEA